MMRSHQPEGLAMKITSVETFAVKGNFAPWMFCAIRTDEGLTGYSEFGEGRVWRGMRGLVDDIALLVMGKDPRPVEAHYIHMVRSTRMIYGGATWQAIAGIELALWDLKAKALGVPVCELVGGPTRSEQKVYWSHLLSYQANYHEVLGVEPVRSYDDIRVLVREAMEAGYDSFKTNILLPGDPFRGLGQGRSGPHDQTLTREILNAAVRQIEVMREEAGPDAQICLDVNEHFKADGQIRLAQALEPYDLMWLELDNLDAESCRMVKDATRTPICTGEQRLGPVNYADLLASRAMDAMKVDSQWQGFIPARRVAHMAELYDINIAPHNFNGHLSTFQTMNFCASVTNVKISESDPASVPWRDEVVTEVPEIENGMVKIPTKPGWGTDLDEKAAKKYEYTG
jgi:L-alanine-DL-glutamate epimerase-like enolase superfamily enzyme